MKCKRSALVFFVFNLMKYKRSALIIFVISNYRIKNNIKFVIFLKKKKKKKKKREPQIAPRMKFKTNHQK